MKKFSLILFVIVLMFAYAGYWFYKNAKPVSGDASYVNFNVSSGANASQIGSELFKRGLIKNTLTFKIYSQLTGVSLKIQAGDYRLSPSLSLFEIVSRLSRAPLTVKVTIPEGLRREEIASKMTKSFNQNNVFLNDFLSASESKEGRLFPDTYIFAGSATPAGIIAKMESNFFSRTDSLILSNPKLSKTELLVLASLVERESGTDEERPVIAGIMMNRLNIGMPLQIDATVQYALANLKCKSNTIGCKWWNPVETDDLAVSSAYNTYKNPGLPPSPIASPGLASIKAAYNPAKTDYYYYIHDAQGLIHYARNLDEQNANIRTYLR